MADICKNCGAEMPDGAAFCPNCGGTREPEPVKKTKKMKWWMIAAPIAAVVLVLVLVVVLMWDAIYIRIAPTAVLAEAMNNTITELSTRSVGTPLEVMNGVVDDEGKYTVDMDMSMVYDTYMTLDANIVAQGDVKNSQGQVDLEASISLYSYLNFDMNMGAYADKDQLALNWEQLFGENYYGIDYDTFGEDVRSNSLIYDSLGEDTVAEIEEMLGQYQEQVDVSTEYTDGLEIDDDYIQILKDFLMEHKPVVSTGDFALNGVDQKCYNISYTLTDEDLASLIEELAAVLEEDESLRQFYWNGYSAYASIETGGPEAADEAWDVFIDSLEDLADSIRESGGMSTLSFLLYNEKVVNLRYSYAAEDADAAVSLTLGENSAEDDIVILYEFDSDENSGTLELTLHTEKDETSVEEQLSIVLQDAYDDVDMVLGYAWNRDSGDFQVTVEGTENGEDLTFQIDFLLLEEGEGITLEIPDLFAVLSATADPEMASYYEGMHFGIRCTVHPGAEITKPEYINIRDLNEDKIIEMEDNLNRNYGFGF